jgi:hypothetical protein
LDFGFWNFYDGVFFLFSFYYFHENRDKYMFTNQIIYLYSRIYFSAVCYTSHKLTKLSSSLMQWVQQMLVNLIYKYRCWSTKISEIYLVFLNFLLGILVYLNLHSKDSGYPMSTTITSVTPLVNTMTDIWRTPTFIFWFCLQTSQADDKVLQSNDINL